MYKDTISIITTPDSDWGKAYNSIKSLFVQTKNIYTPDAFLSSEELKLSLPFQKSTIRKANIATFVSSILGSQEVGFFRLNESFFNVFMPDGGRLSSSSATLFFNLKTQAYISAILRDEGSKDEILEHLFPLNMGEILLNRHPMERQLTPNEQNFVDQIMHQRFCLMNSTDNNKLREKYAWQEFVQDVCLYVSKNLNIFISHPVS
jgi:hypothetical protein